MLWKAVTGVACLKCPTAASATDYKILGCQFTPKVVFSTDKIKENFPLPPKAEDATGGNDGGVGEVKDKKGGDSPSSKSNTSETSKTSKPHFSKFEKTVRTFTLISIVAAIIVVATGFIVAILVATKIFV